MHLLKALAVAFFTTVSFLSIGQDSTVVQDFETWSGIKLEKSFLEKKLKLDLNQEFRFDDNSTHLDQYFTELGAQYKLPLGFSIDANYRFIRNNRNSGYRNEGRYNFDLGYKHKFERFKFSTRFRFQSKNVLGTTKEEGDFPVNKMRLKILGAYNIKKWPLDPYFSIEVFHASTTNRISYVDGIYESESISGFEKMRYTFGTNYKLNKKIELGGFFRMENEFISYPLFYNTPATYYIAGFDLTFKL